MTGDCLSLKLTLYAMLHLNDLVMRNNSKRSKAHTAVNMHTCTSRNTNYQPVLFTGFENIASILTVHFPITNRYTT